MGESFKFTNNLLIGMHAVMQSLPKGISVHYLSGRCFEKNAYKVTPKVQHIQAVMTVQLEHYF